MIDVTTVAIKTAGIVTGVLTLAQILPLNLPENVLLVAISGFCGGMCRWIAERDHIWPKGLGRMVGGALVAVFLWPFGMSFMDGIFSKMSMDPIQALMMGGFVSGLLGMSLVGFLIDVFKSRKGAFEGDGGDG